MHRPVKVWDIYIRLFHWSLVILVATSMISVRFSEMDIHVASGLLVLGLLVFRLLWGLFGSTTAQFHRFVRGPRAILAYLRGTDAGSSTPVIGHSPLAALSVLAMLISLVIQVGTGLVADDDIYVTGPLRKFVTSEFSSWATGLHGLNADILLALIALHVAAILVYLLLKGRNLTSAMVTGRQALPADLASRVAAVKDRHPLLAIAAIGAAAAVTYFMWTV
ncbi:MAG: cytochrome b/b6 domain-containing protein [Pseudomonadota bacterium]